MAKETQKEKIERLERELLERDRTIEDLNINISKRICEKLELEEKIESLSKELETARFWNDKNNVSDLTIKACKQGNKIKELEEEIQKLKSEKHISNNSRGAGRKSLLSDKKEEIKALRLEGVKIKELAEKYNCSIGLIHKLINE